MDGVQRVIDERVINRARLQIDLTGSIVFDKVDTIEKIQAFKALGVKFFMDDFVTGYSSLSRLTRWLLGQLKIDQSFVGNNGLTSTGATIVKIIIGMGDTWGMEVIAEGVETQAQQVVLQEHGCDFLRPNRCWPQRTGRVQTIEWQLSH